MLYASPNGLVGISGIIQGVISDKLIERTAWQQYNPTTMLGAIYDGKYVGFYTYPADGIQPDGIVGSGGRAFIMQKAVEPYRTLFAHMDVASFAMAEPMSFLDFYAYAAYTDRSNGFIYGVSAIDGNIYQLDADPVNVLPIDWRSKRFYSAAPINYGLIQVDADYNDNARLILQKQIDQITAINQAIYATGVTHGETGGSETGQYTTAGSALQDLPGLLDSASLQVSVFADGMQVFTGSPKNFTPLRLPSGFRANTWEIAIASTYTVRAVTMATTMGEIRQAVYGQQQPTQQPQG
jgi:excinuclease UvrABC helicase subunit UvrB